MWYVSKTPFSHFFCLSLNRTRQRNGGYLEVILFVILHTFQRHIHGFLGLLLALHWPLGLAACGIWLLIAVTMRYSSLSALTAAGLSPVAAAVLGRGELVWLMVVLAVLIYWRHRANIARLRDGTETKIGQKG